MNWTNGGNECGFQCNANYTYYESNNSCVANTQPCYVGNGTGTQTWNGNGWGACENIQCANGYHLEGESQGNDLPRAASIIANNQCIPNKKQVACKEEGKPENASYITGNVEITWNTTNNSWSEPAQCNWKCNDGFHAENGQCVSNTKPNQACNLLPANAQWLAGNTGTVTQVWNGSQGAWLPSLTGNYNKT